MRLQYLRRREKILLTASEALTRAREARAAAAHGS
jgi:hypothetical protein